MVPKIKIPSLSRECWVNWVKHIWVSVSTEQPEDVSLEIYEMFALQLN